MAFSTQRAVSDGTLILLGVSIGYIKQADIGVFYDGLPAGAGTWSWVGTTTNIAFSPAVPTGVEVLLARTTQIDKIINRFTAGAGFTNQSMDTDFQQVLYLNQEAVEGSALTDVFSDVDFHGFKVRNVGTATDSGDAVSLGQYQADALGASAFKDAAAASASAALTSQNAALVSQNAALVSQNASAASAVTSGNSASASGTSASNSDASRVAAVAAQTAAVIARTGAETALDSFDDRYLGSKSTDPTLDNDGNALLVGALYWNTSIPALRVWDGTAPWITFPSVTAGGISNTPAGNISATTVQAALNELDLEKARIGPLSTSGITGAAASGANSDITSLVGPVSTVNGVPLFHHNDIVNGDFRIAQIGTSFAAPVNNTYDLDGWLNSTNSTTSAVVTIARVVGSTAGGLARQATITTADATVAAAELLVDMTRVEGFNIVKYVGNTFTVSFRAKVPVVGIHCVALRNDEADRTYLKEINFPVANTWQDCSFTVVGGLPTAGTWNYTNRVGLIITFSHMCGTNFQSTPDAWLTGNFLATANQVNDCATVGNVWALEKVTMNLGTVAAVSEISYEQELIRCQRYFEKSFNIDTAPTNGLVSNERKSGVVYGAADIGYSGQFLVAKRTGPTFIFYRGNITNADGNWSYYTGSAWVAASSTAAGVIFNTNFSVNLVVSGRTTGQALILDGHWAASARL